MTSLHDTLFEHAAHMAQREDLAILPPGLVLGGLSPAELDALPFGAIRLDDSGVVCAYNAYESQLTGLAPDIVLGRNFFRDVAPCTNNALFRGTFERGLAAGRLDHLFPYTFTYRMRPVNVKVHLVREAASGTNWVLVARAR
jgi:photoactive yellow protein